MEQLFAGPTDRLPSLPLPWSSLCRSLTESRICRRRRARVACCLRVMYVMRAACTFFFENVSTLIELAEQLVLRQRP